jgi:two-component system response regulator FixJ
MADAMRQHVFILDDEPQVGEVIRRILEGAGVKVSCFCEPAVCLAALRPQTCHLLITDLRMPEMDGMEVLAKVKRIAPWIPVLMVSAYGDVQTAVKAVKEGATDFIEKPLEKGNLIHKVYSTLQEIAFPDSSLGKPLSSAEMSVLSLVLDGKSSKEIARLLHRSTRTIEWHRSHLMQKLNAENMLDLAKRATALGLIDVAAKTELFGATETLETACAGDGDRLF